MDRGLNFERRYLLYTTLDQQFCSRTRFFAAAALTNSVFAQLFRLLPRYSLTDVYRLFSEAGAMLEAANRHYGHAIALQSISGVALDDCLVRREQRLLQTYLNARNVHTDGGWEHIRGDLNGLLNDHLITSFFSRCFSRSRQYSTVLAKLRAEITGALDFAEESHRISIGLGIIRHIRVSDY